MPGPDLSRAEWRKSSYSNGTGGSCVEAAELGGNAAPLVVAVRDSKNPSGPALTFTSSDWQVLITSIKTGRLDLARRPLAVPSKTPAELMG